MLVNNKRYETIWLGQDKKHIQIIDQRTLPFQFGMIDLHTTEDVYNAIKDMAVRGAPLIGATGAFGVYLATLEIEDGRDFQKEIIRQGEYLKSSRPTAVNLAFAVDEVVKEAEYAASLHEAQEIALNIAVKRVDKEREYCRRIGEFGLELIEELSKKKNGEPVNILTHCNAGWLACIDYGTATAPIYAAYEKGIPVHVWVDETRPRNQGGKLTAWELGQQGVSHTVIPDNTGGHLMQHGMVDIVIVGSDRTTRTGDVANKIGTYLKALAAKDNNVPFYVALPSSSFDFNLSDGLKEIPIEQRDADEVTHVEGVMDDKICKVNILPKNAKVANYGFDVTPSGLVNGLITERGICEASEEGIVRMFSDLIDDE